MQGREYNFDVQNYTQEIMYDTTGLCNAITFINKGNTPVSINGVLLMPSPLNVAVGDRFAGETVSFGGNEGEIYRGQVKILFPAPIGTDPVVTAIQKYYLQ